MQNILVFLDWHLQDPIKLYKTSYSFESLFFTLHCDIHYFVSQLILLKIQPCKVSCWVPPGTFLIKYSTFVRYIPNKLRTVLYFLGPQSAHFLAKFGHHITIPTPSWYLAGCTRCFQNKSLGFWGQNLAEIWPVVLRGMVGGVFMIFCFITLDFTWKTCALTGHKVTG